MLPIEFGITILSLLSRLAQGAITYAPLDALAGAVLWLVALSAVSLTLDPEARLRPRAPVAQM